MYAHRIIIANTFCTEFAEPEVFAKNAAAKGAAFKAAADAAAATTATNVSLRQCHAGCEC